MCIIREKNKGERTLVFFDLLKKTIKMGGDTHIHYVVTLSED